MSNGGWEFTWTDPLKGKSIICFFVCDISLPSYLILFGSDLQFLLNICNSSCQAFEKFTSDTSCLLAVLLPYYAGEACVSQRSWEQRKPSSRFTEAGSVSGEGSHEWHLTDLKVWETGHGDFFPWEKKWTLFTFLLSRWPCVTEISFNLFTLLAWWSLVWKPKSAH